MKPVIRIAAVAAGVAAALGVRLWRENEQGKKVWSSATDSLNGSQPGTGADRPADHN